MTAKSNVRVRFAPSPTGFFHIGSARSVLFNWLFARKEGGVFVLRIEDTDKERSRPEYEKDIFDGFKWLGLEADESPEKPGAYGPYRQSERTPFYRKYLERLITNRHAYYCFCTKEELEAERQSQLTSGIAPKYNGRCRGIGPEEADKRRVKGESSVIRFRAPEKTVSFHDLIRGLISFDMALNGDFVVAKDLDNPLYNFAVIVDDYEMKISHVIRGEDHIANTPKQIAMQEVLGFPTPHYGHLPLILDPDRSKMSKRNSATAVRDYRTQGYLPEALVNFMALLGWHPHGNEEVMTREELIEKFDVARVQKAGAVFNVEKLDWLNGQYLKAMPITRLIAELATLDLLPKNIPGHQLITATELVRDRIKKLSDWPELTGFLWILPDYPGNKLIWKGSGKETTSEILDAVRIVFEKISEQNFKKEALETALGPLIDAHGKGNVLWPIRYALSGSDASPGPYELLSVLGKTESVRRIRLAYKKING